MHFPVLGRLCLIMANNSHHTYYNYLDSLALFNLVLQPWCMPGGDFLWRISSGCYCQKQG